MLMLLLASISIGAYHSSHECANPDTCAICTFQATSCTLSLDAAPGSDHYDEPILLSIITLPERVQSHSKQASSLPTLLLNLLDLIKKFCVDSLHCFRNWEFATATISL